MRRVLSTMICLSVTVLALGASLTTPAQAQRNRPTSFADLVEDVMPAVVNISTTQMPQQRIPGLPPAPANEGFSLGSGFIIDPTGFVVTNNHVIQNADAITITLHDGEEFTAKLRGVDPETDLAVLQIEADQSFPWVSFGNSENMRVGDWVIAIGQPFGLGGSVSAGIVSAQNRDIESGIYDDFIQTDAAINRGNSGGPLFNMRGDVVGVNTIIFSRTGGSQGVGFAIPGNLAARVVTQLIEFGETFRGYLGVLLDDISPEKQAELGLENRRGALVAGLPSAGGPAALAGIQQNDVIIRYDGRRVSDRRDLTKFIAETQVGETVPVVIIRQGSRQTLRVTISRRETVTAMAIDPAQQNAGLSLSTPTDEMARSFGLPVQIEGALITHIAPQSPVGTEVQAGDIILEIGLERVRNPDEVTGRLNVLRAQGAGPVPMLVRRGDELFYTHIDP